MIHKTGTGPARSKSDTASARGRSGEGDRRRSGDECQDGLNVNGDGPAMESCEDVNQGEEQQSATAQIRDIYERLSAAFGQQQWWPAKNATEVAIGAILTQNTAWRNVERAIANLRAAKAIDWRVLRDMSHARLEELIRPSGTYRIKAKRLRALVDTLWRDHGGSLRRMLAGNLDSARARLLAVSGIGRETADAILLYAGGKPSFVVDAYTMRVLRRHFLIDNRAEYDDVRDLFQRAMPAEAQCYNEYHALLVQVGKHHCGKTPDCTGCPLDGLRHDPNR